MNPHDVTHGVLFGQKELTRLASMPHGATAKERTIEFPYRSADRFIVCVREDLDTP